VNVRVLPEDVLGAVAVVHVEVDDEQPRHPPLAHQVARGDGDVVEEAEAHRPLGCRVVPRGAHGGEGTRIASGRPRSEVGREDRGAGREERDFDRARRDDGVGIGETAARGGEPRERVDEPPRVDGEDGLERGGLGRGREEHAREARRRLDPPGREEALGPLGVRSGPVEQEVVARDPVHAALGDRRGAPSGEPPERLVLAIGRG